MPSALTPPNTRSIQFDVADCTLREQSEEHLGWSTSNDVFLVLRVPKARADWQFDLQDLSAARNYFSSKCADNGGVLLEIEKVVVHGRHALLGLFKYRSPIPQSLGMMFSNVLWIPYGDWLLEISVESPERGDTGLREAVVLAMGKNNESTAEQATPIVLDNTEDMFATMRARPLQALPSDDRRFDDMFPEHPLSKVRHRMRQLISTVSIAEEVTAPGLPKRAPWWKFW
ncbi:hypothetical protein [Diaphorobacter caeni]|uniref:hypothetical protein n=1 Tax=Diaphorobacter caeni TaxID=2784387 RepID=UPI00189099EE|nr:hypothetical protein [Diaphorobacter caeni]MBF5005792.1 hypothetical protein [Diaphorobacter caeni]